MSTISIRFDRVVPKDKEIKVPGHGLGRTFIHHDSRSWDYRVERHLLPVSVEHTRHISTLDQGDLGSCVGNATLGACGTDPCYGSILAANPKFDWTERQALNIYSLATTLDPFSGSYPPNDTGSDGLSGAKAAQKMGLVSGYLHAMSTDEMISGIQERPGMVGTVWTTNMDKVDTNTGLIAKPASGTVRGGHEYEFWKYDAERGLFWFWQSWGNWGLSGSGKFCMQVEDFADLLAQDGDATFLTSLAEQPPTPTPTEIVTRSYPKVDWDSVQAWANSPHNWHKATVASKIIKE
jgi:hypothetical protein